MIQIVITYRVDKWKDFLESNFLEGVASVLGTYGLNTVKTAYHCFSENQGLTYVWILAESHCIMHTYKEHQTVFIDVFSCKEIHTVDTLSDLAHDMGKLIDGVVCDKRIIRRQVA